MADPIDTDAVELRIRCPGLGKGDLIVDRLGPCACGEVNDGISCGFESDRGGFVMSFADLLAVLEAVTAYRERTGEFEIEIGGAP